MSSLFVQSESDGLPIESQRVRQLFSYPERVAESHFLRREIADRMHERLSMIKLEPQYVLDAGCGEGTDLPLLQKSFPASHVIGLDVSYPMLTNGVGPDAEPEAGLLVRWMSSRKKNESKRVCADFGELPFAPGLFDVLWSNLALHWHSRPDQVFKEWLRVLRHDGFLMFSCFGPNTFLEVREAFAQVDRFQHVQPFVEMHDLGDMLVTAGFGAPVLDREIITVTYSDVDKLFTDVRAFGGNASMNRRRQFLGKQAYERLLAFFEEKVNEDNQFCLQFEIIYGHAIRLASAAPRNEEAIIHVMPRK